MRRHGVISLSETPDNLLMWSHYAKDHKGISVEFNIDLQAPFSLFNIPYLHTASDMRFGKVNYRKEREYPSAFNSSEVSVVAEHYYLTKSEEWSYEKEHRFIVPFTMANKILVDLNAPKAMITLSDLGINVTQTSKEGIIDVTTQLLLPDYERLACAFAHSHENGFMFLICLDERNISKLFLGVNLDVSGFRDLIDNAYEGSPYVSYRSINGEYSGVYKGVVHDSRFEIVFELLQKNG